MNKPMYEVWVVDMEEKLLLATPEGRLEAMTILAEAEAWALDLTDNVNVKYAFVIERRKVRTFEGKGLLIQQAQEAKDAKNEKGGFRKAPQDPPPSPTAG